MFVGFCIGPKCLMDPAGDIARDCMVAILSSIAEDAWDTSYKLCETLKLKETEQVKLAGSETPLVTPSRIPRIRHSTSY